MLGNIVSWNVRGLCLLAEHFLVKDFFYLHFANVCCLPESKFEEIHMSTWREIGGQRVELLLDGMVWSCLVGLFSWASSV